MDNIYHRFSSSLKQYGAGRKNRVGVLLVNLGSPDAPTRRGLRKYLREFLSDRRVIEVPRLIWKPILHGIILPFRSPDSAAKYRNVWTEEGSPLISITKRQVARLQDIVDRRYGTVEGGASEGEGEEGNESLPIPMQRSRVLVEWAMRYGTPSVAAGLRKLREEGCRHILVFPLYPQTCAATTTTVFDVVAQELAREKKDRKTGAESWRMFPHLRFVSGYGDHPSYIKALASRVKRHWTKAGKRRRLVMSFHGIPADLIKKGDAYACFCSKTARLLAEELKLGEEEFDMVFQSRFGSTEWLQPYCDERLEEIAAEGHEEVDVICPGFSADCLETLDEIQREYGELFHQAHEKRGTTGRLFYIKALNDSPEGMQMLGDIVDENLQGWL
eukprot:Cvel_26873.t1-p1 / transcript=Cvel_26873.t1 / gene=Cvel_26873 / organism=Chromera_velia_CCMP2878 / gene_product=Ferrochelatase, putative / transcript_product=Ferrochelatase, putative / location=Cvel_scaffold3263:12653-16601(+) / protein_length=386 / sequence_SO=supercontig / SO=protein_coding / is_pseudo=false